MSCAPLNACLSSRDQIEDENAKREHEQTVDKGPTDVRNQTYQPEQY
jgi:hypothetical protein